MPHAISGATWRKGLRQVTGAAATEKQFEAKLF